MAIAILVGRNKSEQHAYSWFAEKWKQALLALNPNLDIRIWPDCGNPHDIDYLLVWNHPLGKLNQFSHAKLIASLGAGVDHLLIDPDIDKQIPIVRVIDPYMANDIMQYVVAYVLNYIKRVPHWANKQQQKIWFREPPFTHSNKTIGMMGLGYLGGKTAQLLAQLGLKTTGWSQSAKTLAGISHFAGSSQFHDFLSQTHILICMLPLTNVTRNLLNQQTFSHLPKGAYLINVGRGSQLVEEDLLAALDSGQLSGACLDVFREEPLPSNHPFWSHPNIIVTPHIASVTNPNTAAPQILENYHRVLHSKELLHRVDPLKGY